MAQEFSVSGSITVRRLRTGATLGLAIRVTGQLVQVVNMDTGNVTPDWTKEENQPILTPEASVSPSGASVAITVNSGQGWSYNSGLLSFTGSEVDGWIEETRTDENASDGPRFAYNPTTHALKIISNLASKENYASDTLQFTCTLDYESLTYEMSASQVVMIVPGGTTGYFGYVSVDTHILNQETKSATISALLVNGDSFAQKFSTKWYTRYVDDGNIFTPHNGESTSTTTGIVEIKVDRDDVNGGNNNETGNSATGGTLFICQFYNDEGTLVATDAVNIVDEADEYTLEMSISEGTTLDASEYVTVRAMIWSQTEKSAPSNLKTATFVISVLTPEFEVNRSEETTTTTSAYAEMKVYASDSLDGNDVNVTADATFELNVN